MIEDDIKWKTTFDSVEYDVGLNATLDCTKPCMKDDLECRMTFDGEKHLMEGNLLLKMDFGRKQTWMKFNLD